jgi:hypothetical protein
MVVGVHLDRQAFLEPRLQLRVLRIDAARHDRHRGTAVDLLEPVEDRPQEGLILGAVAHVVDSQRDHALDPLLADPLGSDQLGKIAVRIIRVQRPVEIREPIAIGSVSSDRQKEYSQRGECPRHSNHSCENRSLCAAYRNRSAENSHAEARRRREEQ